jgi:hypothetical protein
MSGPTPRFALLVAAALLAACAPDTDAPERADSPAAGTAPGRAPAEPGTEPGADTGPSAGPGAEADRPGVPLRRILDRSYDRDPDGQLTILDAMAPAPAADTATVQNRHDPTVTDTIVTLRYDGLAIAVHHAGPTGKEIVREITVSNEAYQTGLGFGVGAPLDAVVEAMGEPASTDGTTRVWEIREGERDPTPIYLEVTFDAEGRVESVTWSYYVG